MLRPPAIDAPHCPQSYETLLEMEGAILEGVQFALVKAGIDQGAFIASRFVETLTDEDRLPHYKLFAMRWQVEG